MSHTLDTPYIVSMLLAVAVSVGLALDALRRRGGPGTTLFVWLNLATAVWVAGHGLALTSADVGYVCVMNFYPSPRTNSRPR